MNRTYSAADLRRKTQIKKICPPLTLLLLLLCIPFQTTAAITTEKTPADVYLQVQFLAEDVRTLRTKNNITNDWPHLEIETGHDPSHVFQKALEVMEKINRYRINIIKTGGISIPRFPGRDITPNEVYSVVVRLRRELELLVAHETDYAHNDQVTQEYKTPNHVYAALSEVSIALEETLGLRSITPSEVYTRSMQVITLVQFLRKSQSLPPNVAKPELTRGKLPNHALKSVLDLLATIRSAEQNLWMQPIKPPILPRRIIVPSDVYDSLGVVMAELRRIQYRLGLEREFPAPEAQMGKTPDDVMQNVCWAGLLLPDFAQDKPLQQHDRRALKKTPSHVFSITEHIQKNLKRYRRLRGIKTPIRKPEMIPGLQPQHVFGKGIEIMEKIVLLRQRQHLGSTSIPHYPLRAFSPSEVYDLALRIDEELSLIYQQEGMEQAGTWVTAIQVNEYEDKQPSDIFFTMQQIVHLLDSILGSNGSSPNEVFREALTIQTEIQLIAESLGETIPLEIWMAQPLKPATIPADVLAKTGELQDLIDLMKRRAGMFDVLPLAASPGKHVTPTDVFNQVRLIESELTELKVFLAIFRIAERAPLQTHKTPAHVLQVLEGVADALRILLHQKEEQP